MFTLGGDDTKDRMLKISQSLVNALAYETTTEFKDGTFKHLRLLLECRMHGYEFHRFFQPRHDRFYMGIEDIQVEWNYASGEGIEEWGNSFRYLVEALVYVDSLHSPCTRN